MCKAQHHTHEQRHLYVQCREQWYVDTPYPFRGMAIDVHIKWVMTWAEDLTHELNNLTEKCEEMPQDTKLAKSVSESYREQATLTTVPRNRDCTSC